MRKLAPKVWTYAQAESPPDVAPPAIAIPQIDSRAFGDGSHPTTRLCAGALDVVLRSRRPGSVLDVGTGSGILARICRERGIGRIAATDIDPVAVETARRNFDLDASSVDIALLNVPPDHWGPCFDVVVANILEEPLRELASPLAAALAPGGLLMVSGFMRRQVPSIRVAFTSVGLVFESQAHLDDWALTSFVLSSRA